MKIFSAEQIRQWDQFTIDNEPISSLALMERASTVFVDWWVEKYPSPVPVMVFCGTGNNGGDGLVVARLLSARSYSVTVFFCRIGQPSVDCQVNYQALSAVPEVTIRELRTGDPFPDFQSGHLVIDALFGAGLNRPITEYWAELIDHINESNLVISSIDIPSGLFLNQTSKKNKVIKAQHTLSFQAPKLALLLPENYQFVKNWSFRSIELDSTFAETQTSDHHFLTRSDVKSWIKVRGKFDHKGTYGHALLVTGSYGKIGAALLAAKACLRSGVGLLSIHLPACGYAIMQGQVPEAMVQIDKNQDFWTDNIKAEAYKAIGIGCGIGQEKATELALLDLINKAECPLVLDADALNLLSKDRKSLSILPRNTIITPHPKEFQRLYGETTDDFHRLALLRKKAMSLGIIIILKGAYTCIALPTGKCYFNSTGNPGMATGGSGDALTGILTGLLAQGYAPDKAALIGVFLHGLAGDIASTKESEYAMLPSDLIAHIGRAFMQIKSSTNI